LGCILGKALYEEILVDMAFTSFFLSKWLGEQSYLHDLLSVNSELYQGLVYIKNYKEDVESDLILNFTIVDN
ncbi:34467_t:CDS:2, partial [Gigaspora margarita]